MRWTDLAGLSSPSLMTIGTIEQPEANKPAVRVKELAERDRRRLLMHFLALDDNDRLLRFSSALPDDLITRYVQKLDFSRDAVFGVYDDTLALAGVGHLVFEPREALPAWSDVTQKARIAEFGITVAANARGIGIGSKLFERAVIHCRNEGVDTLHMHCLSPNQAVIHIAKKVGLEIHRESGKADVCLKLRPVDLGRTLAEAVGEPFASLNYPAEVGAKAMPKWWRRLPGMKCK